MLLKDKLRHIKTFKSLFEQNPFELGSTKLEVVRGMPLPLTVLETVLDWQELEAREGAEAKKGA